MSCNINLYPVHFQDKCRPSQCKGLSSYPRANMCWDLTTAGLHFLPAARLMHLALAGRLSQAYPLPKVCCSSPLQPRPSQPGAEDLSPGSGVGERLLWCCQDRMGMAATISLLSRCEDMTPTLVTPTPRPSTEGGGRWYNGGGEEEEARWGPEFQEVWKYTT